MIHSDFRISPKFEIRYLPTKIQKFLWVGDCVLFSKFLRISKIGSLCIIFRKNWKFLRNFPKICDFRENRKMIHSDSANRKLIHMRPTGPPF